jgi:hypothetical protein
LGDKIAGSYSVKKTISGRSAATAEAIITVIVDGVIYFGSSGTVVATLSADGKMSASFDIVLTSSGGQTLTISGGKFSALAIGVPPVTCRITSITYANTKSGCDNMDSYSFYYNAEGKLSKAVSISDVVLFTYDLTGKLVGIFSAVNEANYSSITNLNFVYSGTVLTSFSAKASGSESGKPFNQTGNAVFSYSGVQIAGLQTSVSGNASTHSLTFSNTGANLSTETDIYTSSTPGQNSVTVKQYQNYDTKKNPFALLAQLSGTPVSFIYGGIDDFFRFFSFSANNPGSTSRSSGGFTDVSTFAYTYNAQNYPTQIIYTYGSGSCVDTITIAYTGCQ